MRLLDVRHEQTAVFAAEATAKLTRTPGLAVLTAGPGRHQRRQRGDQRLVQRLAAARRRRPGAGVPVGHRQPAGARPPAAAGAGHQAGRHRRDRRRGRRRGRRRAAARHRTAPRAGVPRRTDGPVLQPRRRRAARARRCASGTRPTPTTSPGSARCSPAPSVRCWSSARTCGPTAPRTPRSGWPRPPGVPVITNGMGRGVLPAGHPLLVTRARSEAFGRADLVVVVGTPLDFRLGYGTFGGKDGRRPAAVVHLADSPGQLAGHVELAASAAGDLSHGARRRAEGVGGRRQLDGVRRLDDPAAGHRARRRRQGPRAAGQRRRPDPPGADLRRAQPPAGRRRGGDRRRRRLRVVRRASTSSRRHPAAGSTPARTAAWAPASATRSPRGWRGPAARWCCCSATARPASR